MSRSKIKTASITDDAVTGAKIENSPTIATNLSVTGDLTVDTNTLHVDAANNRVGIGTTSPARPLTISGAAAGIQVHETDASGIYAFVSQGGNLFIQDDADSNPQIQFNKTSSYIRSVASGGHIFTNNSADIVKFASDGNVGIGTTSPSSKLHVDNGSSHAGVIVKGGDASTNYSGGSLLLANPGMATNYGGTYLYHHKAGGSGNTHASFNISQRNASGGYVSNIWNVDYQNSVQAFYVPNGGVSGAAVFQINSLGHFFHKANHAGVIGTFENINSSNPDGIDVAFTGAAPDNNSRYFYRGRDTAINRYYVYSDGDVRNHDNSYGATSDVKLKEQITDASSQWDDIKALRVRKYKMKSDVSAKGDSNELWRIGVIAQEVEAAGMNALVRNDPDIDNDGKDLGTTTKAMKYSILYMKAVKALQEAMTRIETLEAKVATLEAGE